MSYLVTCLLSSTEEKKKIPNDVEHLGFILNSYSTPPLPREKGADMHFCEDPPSRKPEKKPPSHETCLINDTSNKLPLYKATNHLARQGWDIPAKFWINIVTQHNKRIKIFQNTSIKKNH